MRKLTLSILSALAITLAMASATFAQTSPPLPNSVRAISFGTWSIPGSGANNFFFSPTGLCSVNGGFGNAFFPFNTNAPVYIQDSPSDANNEVVTPSAVTAPGASGCGFAASPAHSHLQFNILSGTAGLQEALNQIASSSSPAQTIVIDQAWYRYITATGGTASSVIAAAVGSVNVNLVDQTQSPWAWYSWNGSQYVKLGFSGSNYGNLVNGQFFGYKNTSLTPIAAPTNGTFTATANTSGITTGTYRPTQTCVDPLGGETLPGSDSATVTTSSSLGNITSTAPTCPTGSVGWEFYLSAASGGAGTEIFYTPTQAGCTTLSAIGVKPSCALTSGSVTSALVTGTGDVPLQASAYAMAIEAQDTVPTPYLKSWPPFAVTGVQTFSDPYVLAQFRFPAGYMNQIGKAVQICGNYNLTPSSTGTDVVTVVAGPYFDVSTGTVATWTSGALTNVAYEAPFCITLTTAVTGASGTFEAHGTMAFAIASTGAIPHVGYTDPNTATIAIGDLTKEISVWFVSTPGSSNVTQGQMRQFTVTPLN